MQNIDIDNNWILWKGMGGIVLSSKKYDHAFYIKDIENSIHNPISFHDKIFFQEHLSEMQEIILRFRELEIFI